MKDKTKKIKELAKEKSENRQNEVIDTIKQMIKKGEKISFYSVQKKTGASKSYLYGNEVISNMIRDVREQDNNVTKTTQSKDSIIKMLNLKLKKLETEIKALKESNSDSYKTKYENLLKENAELKQQLKNSYTY